MKCKICDCDTQKQFEHIVLNKYNVSFYRCGNCEFLQTEEPYWLAESYNEPINRTDTGYITRNVYLSKKALGLFFVLFRNKGSYVDFAGGHGILTRLMRDYGLDYYWDDKYTPNLFAQGFEYSKGKKYTGATCFECFEHFSSPLPDIEKILDSIDTLFFSTRLLPEKLPEMDWEYYSFGHGQHIAFYSKKTLEYIASKYSMNFYTNGDNQHVFTKKKIPFFRFLMTITRLPVDIFIKKFFLTTKIVTDQKLLRKKGFK